MTSHRFLYRLCWRKRQLIPFVIITSCITIIMILTLGYQHIDITNKIKDVQAYTRHHPLTKNIERFVATYGKSTVNVLRTGEHANKLELAKDALEQQLLKLDSKLPGMANINALPVGKVGSTYNYTPATVQLDPSFKPVHRTELYRVLKQQQPAVFGQWESSKVKGCEGNFVGYNSNFALLSDVVLDRKYATGNAGGEDIMAVVNQPEKSEYYTYKPGIFQMPCTVRTAYYFNGGSNPLNEWLTNLKTRDVNVNEAVDENRAQFTIAITRYEYVNMYHTMTDFYNAFLMMEFFNQSQASTNILLIDGHPKGSLDVTWKVLFNSSMRLSSLPTRTRFQHLVWSTLGYESLLNQHSKDTIPLVPEFRDFFLSSFHINDTHQLDCDKPSVTFIWRHDYMAHPRNPSAHITRKIDNERELVATLQRRFPQITVRGVQLDLFDMQQQLQLIAKTDILIGMHGAGLSHGLFLPQHAAVLEFLPNYWSAANIHFMAFAKWRGILYERWVNKDPHNEVPGHFTKIPPAVLDTRVKKLLQKMCANSKGSLNRYVTNDTTSTGTYGTNS